MMTMILKMMVTKLMIVMMIAMKLIIWMKLHQGGDPPL